MFIHIKYVCVIYTICARKRRYYRKPHSDRFYRLLTRILYLYVMMLCYIVICYTHIHFISKGFTVNLHVSEKPIDVLLTGLPHKYGIHLLMLFNALLHTHTFGADLIVHTKLFIYIVLMVKYT